LSQILLTEVFRKALVDLAAAPFKEYKQLRGKWANEDHFSNPGKDEKKKKEKEKRRKERKRRRRRRREEEEGEKEKEKEKLKERMRKRREEEEKDKDNDWGKDRRTEGIIDETHRILNYLLKEKRFHLLLSLIYLLCFF
jgi:hypothetical protein